MGLCYSKLFKTTSNSSNPSCNAYSPTEYSSVPIAKNLPLHPFCHLNCSTEWSPTPKNLPLLRLPFFALLEVFKSLDPIELCPVTSFEYTVWCISDQRWSSVLKCIIQNQVQPLESFVLTRTSKTKDLEWALQNVKVTRKIFIQTYTHVYSFPRLNLTMFKSCKYIELQLSWLKICALNGFIEEWIAGNFPNLQYMHIRSDDFKECWCNHMFKREEMKQFGVRRRLVIDENLSVDCTGGCDIQAVNGTKATMQMDRESPNSFELFVWNN